MNKLQRICAWCKKDMGTKDGKGISGISHGMCPECAAKENNQLDLSDGRLTSFPANEKPGAGGLEQPASPGNGKIHFDAADLQRQLSELCEGNHIKVKTNLHQGIAVNIRSTDKGDIVTVNPKRWRGTKKTERLTDFIMQAVVNNYG